MQYRLFYSEYVVFGIIDIGTDTIHILIVMNQAKFFSCDVHCLTFWSEIGYWGALASPGDLISHPSWY